MQSAATQLLSTPDKEELEVPLALQGLQVPLGFRV